MSRLKRALQRARARLNFVIDAEYARAAHWRARCLRAAQPELEQLQLPLLRQRLAEFQGRGLCPGPQFRRAADLTEPAALRALPILRRGDLRALLPTLERLYAGRRDVYSYVTGGATAEPVRFMHSRLHYRRASGCAFEFYLMLGWRPGMPRLRMWASGPDLRAGREANRGWRGALRQWLEHSRTLVSVFPTDDDYRRFAAIALATPGCAVCGYTSALEDCARVMIAERITLPPGHLATAWSMAEQLDTDQRQLIERALGVRLREHYGTRECSTIAVECAHGNRHVNPRYVVEVVDADDNSLVPDGKVGTLLITDLLNDVTPFIRYEIGDLGAVEWRDCACGNSGPCLVRISGRKAAVIMLPSGRRVSTHFFYRHLRKQPWIHRHAVLRTGPLSFEIRYSGQEAQAQELRAAAQEASRVMDGAEISIIRTEDLPRAPSGKIIPYRDLTDGSGRDEFGATATGQRQRPTDAPAE
jgi:phenylacetate-CoA ligase